MLSLAVTVIALLFTSCSGSDDTTPSVIIPVNGPTADIVVVSPEPYLVNRPILINGTGSLLASAYTWSVTADSSGAVAVLNEPVKGAAELTADTAGLYFVTLTVANEDGTDSALVIIDMGIEETPGCLSNSDCAEPASVCDTVQNVCVECLTFADCGFKPGTVCSQGSCVCGGGLDWCAPDQCVNLNTDSENCGSCGHQCFGSCSAGSCSDPWEPVSSDNAPSARYLHNAVWASEAGVMIVWGGYSASKGYMSSGGMYNPATRTWTPISIVNAPSPRRGATAVWTGSEMIVWGGRDVDGYLQDGGRFDPVQNKWKPVSITGAPDPRLYHTAVWTGDVMIVWGGEDAGGWSLYSGGIYNDASDSWSVTAPVSSGNTRQQHTAVWAESSGAMWIYGGFGLLSGGTTDRYQPTTTSYGGESYDPDTNGWSLITNTFQPSARANHTAVWVNGQMIVWGGYDGIGYLDTGAVYNGSAWVALNGVAPAGRRFHTAVFIASVNRIIVWGGTGLNDSYMNSGGELDVDTLEWISSTPVIVEGRYYHTAVSTGDAMIIWGGLGSGGALDSGGIYRPE